MKTNIVSSLNLVAPKITKLSPKPCPKAVTTLTKTNVDLLASKDESSQPWSFFLFKNYKLIKNPSKTHIQFKKDGIYVGKSQATTGITTDSVEINRTSKQIFTPNDFKPVTPAAQIVNHFFSPASEMRSYYNLCKKNPNLISEFTSLLASSTNKSEREVDVALYDMQPSKIFNTPFIKNFMKTTYNTVVGRKKSNIGLSSVYMEAGEERRNIITQAHTDFMDTLRTSISGTGSEVISTLLNAATGNYKTIIPGTYKSLNSIINTCRSAVSNNEKKQKLIDTAQKKYELELKSANVSDLVVRLRRAGKISQENIDKAISNAKEITD